MVFFAFSCNCVSLKDSTQPDDVLLCCILDTMQVDLYLQYWLFNSHAKLVNSVFTICVQLLQKDQMPSPAVSVVLTAKYFFIDPVQLACRVWGENLVIEQLEARICLASYFSADNLQIHQQGPWVCEFECMNDQHLFILSNYSDCEIVCKKILMILRARKGNQKEREVQIITDASDI